ncbi:MAG: Raf kinase inhibitor-like YbhB/YbcL family protein [Planctomycetota bacterium]|jgi:Raf kinase inhibitor-like YbhB/YbcL family protein
MILSTTSFATGGRIPADFAFAKHDPDTHATFAGNRNPQLAWTDVPEGVKSFALICVDPCAPTVGDDVNREGHSVSIDLPRADFYHWLMVDIPADVREIEEGSCSDGVTTGGKQDPGGPAGNRQGSQDYTSWFASDPDMKGTYLGYDGPAPPWNDEMEHRYHFRLYALDVERLDVGDAFTSGEMLKAMENHIISMAWIEGGYTQNPDLL